MALPKDIPTLQHMQSKKFSRPDNVFWTQEILTHLTRYEVSPKLCHTCTDYFPIITEISLPQDHIEEPSTHDCRNVEWKEFREKLQKELSKLPTPAPIETEDQLKQAIKVLTEAIQNTIQMQVPVRRPQADSKRWWNSDLKKMKKELNKLRNTLFKHRAIATHPIHLQVRQKANRYGDKMISVSRSSPVQFLTLKGPQLQPQPVLIYLHWSKNQTGPV